MSRQAESCNRYEFCKFSRTDGRRINDAKINPVYDICIRRVPGAQAESAQFRGRFAAKVQWGLPGMVGLMPRSANHALRYLHHTETGLVFYEFGGMPGMRSSHWTVTLSEKKQNGWNYLRRPGTHLLRQMERDWEEGYLIWCQLKNTLKIWSIIYYCALLSTKKHVKVSAWCITFCFHLLIHGLLHKPCWHEWLVMIKRVDVGKGLPWILVAVT